MATMEMEVWKPIARVDGKYEVSNFGRVRSMMDKLNTYIGKIKKLQKNRDGYWAIIMYPEKGVGVHALVHVLVAEAFIGPCPDGYQVDHRNRNRADAREVNLRYLLAEKNKAFGRFNKSTKLTWKQVNKIRYLYRSGDWTTEELARLFNLKSSSTIKSVLNNKTWKKEAA